MIAGVGAGVLTTINLEGKRITVNSKEEEKEEGWTGALCDPPKAKSHTTSRPVPAPTWHVGRLRKMFSARPPPPKKTITLIPTNEKRRRAKVKKERNEAAYQAEEEELNETKRVRAKMDAKDKVKKGKVKARVRTQDGDQEIELESGEDVHSGEEDEIEVQRMADALEAAMEPCAPVMVTTTSDRKITVVDANHKIISVLDDIREYKDVTPESISEWVGIDLCNPVNDEYRRSLMRNPGIIWKNTVDGGFTIRRRASHGVENEACLRHLFKVMLPSGQVKVEGSDLSALAIHERELKNTYPEVERSIDMMRAEGGVDYWVDESSREKWRIFYPVPAGVQAAPSLRQLWHSATLPPEVDMREELIARGLRTREEYDRRDERLREARRREAEELEATKKEKRARNKHLRVGDIQGAPESTIDDLLADDEDEG